MKKSNTVKRKPVMKKKTNQALKSQRILKLKEAKMKNKPLPPVDNDALFNSLKNTENSCRSMLATGLSMVELFRNKELIAKLKNPDEVAKMATIFATDLQKYKESLQEIINSADSLKGSNVNDNTDLLLQTITIGQAYQEWIESYNSVVVPIQLDIHAAFEEIEENQGLLTHE